MVGVRPILDLDEPHTSIAGRLFLVGDVSSKSHSKGGSIVVSFPTGLCTDSFD